MLQRFISTGATHSAPTPLTRANNRVHPFRSMLVPSICSRATIATAAQQELSRPTDPATVTCAELRGRPFPVDHCIDYTSAEGKQLFGEALAEGHMNPFFQLSGNYAHQSEPAYCALAVLAMVLNSLQIDPGQTWKRPWRWFSGIVLLPSEEMLACCTDLNEVKQKGITFDQFVTLAACKGGDVQSWRYDQSTLEEFRARIIESTKSDDQVLVASFNRGDLGQTGSGHFAPISGYNTRKDMVLLLEVARFKYPSHWVPVETLYHSMKAVDSETNLPRGYMSIRPKKATHMGVEGV